MASRGSFGGGQSRDILRGRKLKKHPVHYNILYIYNLKIQFKVQIIGILEKINPYY